MAKKPTVTTLQSGFNSTETLNANFEALRDGFDNTLSLDGSTPNAMEADLDLNGNNIIGAAGLLINGTDYLSDVEAAKAAALVAQAAAELAETNAETAETNAESSETAAGLSATAAATSETNAGASETAASGSATASATSATNSATSASGAAASASAASTSETNAATSETNAATSETNAANSATAASSSETAAATSETNASTSETNAATSATSAATSATASATSATAAAASEAGVDADRVAAQAAAATATTKASEASTSETNAATSASTATTKASEAATSATNSATSATESETAKIGAEAAKDAALAALDSFDDRYLGAKASDPTLDNDGNALVAGALYYNTTDDVMKVYEGSSWVAAYASLSGALLATNNLSDLVNATSARTNLGLGTGDSPTFAGLTTTADVSFGDSDKAIFGAGSDLQIYHNGSNSYLDEVGTGNLFVRANNLRLSNADNSQYYLIADNSGFVKLNYAGATKLATTSTGVDVTGTITSDGLDVEGTDGEIVRIASTVDSGTQQEFGIGFATNPSHTHPAAQILAKEFDASDSRAGLNFYTRPDNSDTASVKRLNIDTDGDISFYDDNDTAKFFWDASTERLGLGTTSPFGLLHLQSTAPTVVITDSDGVGVQASGSISFRDSANAQLTSIGLLSSSNSDLDIFQHQAANIDFWTNSQFAMRIDSSGNVGIGTSSPSSNLEVLGGDKTAVSIKSDGHVQLYDNTSPSRAYTFLSRDVSNAMVGGNMRLDASVTTGSHVGYSSGTDARGGSGIVFDNTASGANAYGRISFLQSNDTNDDTWVVREAVSIASTGYVGINKTNPGTALHVNGTVTATSYAGDGSSLTGIAAGAGGGGSDEIFWENGQNVTTNYTITNGKNAMSAGPITIDSGVTVTVGAGETWTVV